VFARRGPKPKFLVDMLADHSVENLCHIGVPLCGARISQLSSIPLEKPYPFLNEQSKLVRWTWMRFLEMLSVLVLDLVPDLVHKRDLDFVQQER
jgi:hypothetical protein